MDHRGIYMEGRTAKSGSILSYGLFVMTLTHTLTHIFGRLYTASFPIIRDEFSLSIQQLGVLAAPLGGYLAARFGSKRWLAASIVMSMTMLSLVTIVPGGIAFVIVYMIYGFVGTLGMAARSALIVNLTPSSQRGVGYALLFLPGSIMGAIAPMVAANLIELFGMARLFPVSIVISIIGLVILVLGIRES